MLVLSRFEGESVVVGDPFKPLGRVTIVEVRGNKIKVGFEFPRDIDIARDEVARRIVAAGKEKPQ